MYPDFSIFGELHKPKQEGVGSIFPILTVSSALFCGIARNSKDTGFVHFHY
jgi:hypothetical protein